VWHSNLSVLDRDTVLHRVKKVWTGGKLHCFKYEGYASTDNDRPQCSGNDMESTQTTYHNLSEVPGSKLHPGLKTISSSI